MPGVCVCVCVVIIIFFFWPTLSCVLVCRCVSLIYVFMCKCYSFMYPYSVIVVIFKGRSVDTEVEMCRCGQGCGGVERVVEVQEVLQRCKLVWSDRRGHQVWVREGVQVGCRRLTDVWWCGKGCVGVGRGVGL